MVQFNVPNCFSGDCDCSGTPPPSGVCPYGDCFSCTPSLCEGPKCCCCSSIDVVLSVRSRCYDRIYFSCNIDGTSPGPGETPFDPDCTQCFDACSRALGGASACASISQNVGDPAWQPSPPDWWTYPPSIGPCECRCVDFVDPNDPTAGCNLTCVTCSGLKCNAHVAVTSGGCNYQFALTPGTGCCGTPAIVDIIFAIDYSGSMGSVIDSVINNVVTLAETLSTTGALARFGLLVFGKTEDCKFDPPVIFPNGEILTTDVQQFSDALQAALPLAGGCEAYFDAVETCLAQYPWSGVENLLFAIGDEPVENGGPIQGGLGDPDGQPSANLLIDLANSLGVTVHVIQPVGGDPLKTDLALGTNGTDIDISTNFSQIVNDLNLNIFGGSCDCLDTTPIPVMLCKGGTGAGGNECIDPDPNIPIRKCIKDDNSDCSCNEPIILDVCGEIVIVEPQDDSLKLVCCGLIEGGGCTCPTENIPPLGCCGIECSGLDICTDFSNVEDAVNAIWCECWQKAINGEFILETVECNRCVIPDPSDPNYNSLDINAIVNCTIKIPDGRGGFIIKTRPELVAEVTAAWADCQQQGGGGEEPPPPPVSTEACLSNCNRIDECITGQIECLDSQDIRTCRSQSECLSPNSGCTSVRNPATTVLNNGIGLVAFEALDNNSVIQIHQFNTSVPAKILPNRKTNYGRLQHSSSWVDRSGNKLAKLYYFENIPTHFMNGVAGIPAPGSLRDLIFFRTGPFQNQCFSLHQTPVGEDTTGKFIQFTIPANYTLSNEFPTNDDVYNIEWFIIDRDDTGLIGSAKTNTTIPGFEFLLQNPAYVNKVLSLSPHIHDGSPVPVANPSLATAWNYMNSIENSHYVFVVYQALENKKWNLYMRQIRLSEYSLDKQIDEASFIALSELGVDELLYRVVCVNDSCLDFGNDFLAERKVTMEIVLKDGREVFNEPFVSANDNSSWELCPGSPAGDFPKKRVFVEFTHSVVCDQCPDQFQFNSIFYNWEMGDEFSVPYTDLNASQLFVLLRKENDSAASIGVSSTIDGIQIQSSQVGVIWFDDPSISTWTTPDTATLSSLTRFKGLDVTNPIPITEFENGHCTHPVVAVNSNNDVFVTYECTDPEIHQIHVTGTSVPNTSFPTGVFSPRQLDANLDYFFAPKDFVYKGSITSSGDGVNQLPDIFIDSNDVVHIVWQSNRDNYWEIYYANSAEEFAPKRITKSLGKSLKPKISGDVRGNLYIVWHDNRFGNWEVMMAYRDGSRDLLLSEQDPYLSGVRNSGYTHYSNLVPITLFNESYTDPLCVSNFIIRFFKDRLLDTAAFDIAQSEFPLAFQIPGMQDDISENTWENSDIAWSILNAGTYDRYGSSTRSKDTILAGSEFYSVKLVFTTQPQFIKFIANSYVDEYEELQALQNEAISLGNNPNSVDINDTQWIQDLNSEDLWISAAHLISGETYDVFDLFRTHASPNASFPKGRYKRIEVRLASGATYNITQIHIVSKIKSRICLAPRETITGQLDLTPSIRVDNNGTQTIETPLPLKTNKNEVHFIAAIGIKDNGQLHVFDDQKRSVSCETCESNSSPWNSTSCSFNIKFENFEISERETKYYNARIRFYADQEKQDLIAQFDTFLNYNLAYFTTDTGSSLQEIWQEDGMEVFSGKSRTIILWPFLSDTSGLVCGVNYWVETAICSGTKGNPCSQSSVEVQDTNKWMCQCSSDRWSTMFGEPPTNIRSITKWKSSGDGHSDTRLTETDHSVNNLNPRIQLRSDLTGLVLYESNRNSTNSYSVYASAFSIFPSSNMYASGAEAITSGQFNDLLIQTDIPITECKGAACGDSGTAMLGGNIAFSLDQYDNIFLAAERIRDPNACEEFQFDKQRSIIVHRCGALANNLIFSRTKEIEESAASCESAKILERFSPISSNAVYKNIIKLARVSSEFALYHITRSKKPVAVVDRCDISIEITAEPETIAVRCRNENDAWSNWYPFSSPIGEYTIKIPWTLSPVSGVKNITIEAATYQGLSTMQVLEIVADYKNIEYLVQFYKIKFGDAPVPGNNLSNTDLLGILASHQDAAFISTNILPQLEGLPVAGIRNPSVLTEGDDKTIVKQLGEYIFVEIIPTSEYLQRLGIETSTNPDDLAPSFDVLQQGEEDLFALPTIYNIQTKIFRGVFPIKKDNKSLFKDGLSFIIPHFKLNCADIFPETSRGTEFIKDKFNVVTSGIIINPENAETTDIWGSERDEFGQIKHQVTIRSSDDPYFVFGDPNYRLKKHE